MARWLFRKSTKNEHENQEPEEAVQQVSPESVEIKSTENDEDHGDIPSEEEDSDGNDAAIAAEGEDPDSAPQEPYRIPPHEQGIWVRCSNCGSPHNLVAICPVCKQPLCRETEACKSHKHETA